MGLGAAGGPGAQILGGEAVPPRPRRGQAAPTCPQGAISEARAQGNLTIK